MPFLATLTVFTPAAAVALAINGLSVLLSVLVPVSVSVRRYAAKCQRHIIIGGSCERRPDRNLKVLKRWGRIVNRGNGRTRRSERRMLQ